MPTLTSIMTTTMRMTKTKKKRRKKACPSGPPLPLSPSPASTAKALTLDSFRAQEKPVLLIFTDPTCGPCNSLMPDVGKWQQELADKLTTVLVSRGSLEENRNKKKQNNLTNVVMQKDNEIADAYLTGGTPTAVLVTPDGKIGSAAAVVREKSASWSSRQSRARCRFRRLAQPRRVLLRSGSRTAGSPWAGQHRQGCTCC